MLQSPASTHVKAELHSLKRIKSATQNQLRVPDVQDLMSIFCLTCGENMSVLCLQPFGVNQPGPYVMYTTVDSNGDLKNASGKSSLCAAP